MIQKKNNIDFIILFYDNPLDGRIYKKLGFEDIDKWTMISEI